MSKIIKAIDYLDLKITKWLYYNIGLSNNPIIRNMPAWIGLYPYEFYVLPGMFIAIFSTYWEKTHTALQFHLLPHWISYGLFQYIKKIFGRGRPGCYNEEINSLIDPGHCVGPAKNYSFPSGHTGVAFSLATSLTMHLYDEKSKKNLLGINFGNDTIRSITIFWAYLVCATLAIQRVSHGYHHFFDVCCGAIIGILLGYTSYTIINYARYCKEESIVGTKSCINNNKIKFGSEWDFENNMFWECAKIFGVLLCSIALVQYLFLIFKKLLKKN